jgi:uncharacterized membrane protein
MLSTVEKAGRVHGDSAIAGGALVYWIGNGLSLVLMGLVLGEVAAGMHLPGPTRWPEAGLVVAVLAATLISLARQLPAQNVLLAAAIIAVMGGVTQWIGTITAMPFGPYVYSPAAGPRLLGVLPWWAPALWVVMVLNARGVARLILRPWRQTRAYGFRLIGLTTLLVVFCQLGLEPFLSRLTGWVRWGPTRVSLGWYGTPFTAFVGEMVTVLLILAFATPVLINKSPRRRPPDYQPLAVWTGMNVLFGAGALAHHLWFAAALSGAAVLVPGWLAVRGAKW